jgi:hypothetical protein
MRRSPDGGKSQTGRNWGDYVVAAREVADQLRLWAVSNGFMSREVLGPTVDALLTAHNVGGLAPRPPDNLPVPRGFAISFIGFNEAANEVVVYTNKIVRKKLAELMPQQGTGGVHISYAVGVPELIGKLPPSPFNTAPGALHNGRYTCGSSVHVGNRLGAGTMGCLVRDAAGTMYGLTNNHVAGNCNYASPGLPVTAPGPVDVGVGGVDPFCVGHHHHGLRMVHGTPDNPNVRPDQNTDAALFKIRDPALVTSMQKDGSYDTPAAIGPIAPGMVVTKVGRTTGRTGGTVRVQVSGAMPVRYKMAELEIDMAVFYEPIFVVEANAPGVFSQPGDSGALVTTLNAQNQRIAVGLVVAGDANKPQISLVLPLEPILQQFGVSLVSGHNI